MGNNTSNKRVEIEKVVPLIEEIAKESGFADYPRKLYEALAVDACSNYKTMSQYAKGQRKTASLKNYNYLLGLVERIRAGDNPIMADGGRIVIVKSQMQELYDRVALKYGIDNGILAGFIGETFSIDKERLEAILRENGKSKDKHTANVAEMLKKMIDKDMFVYTQEKSYNVGDTLYFKGFGIGEVTGVDSKGRIEAVIGGEKRMFVTGVKHDPRAEKHFDYYDPISYM